MYILNCGTAALKKFFITLSSRFVWIHHALLFLHKHDFGSVLKEQELVRSDESRTFVCENRSAVLVNVWK